MENNWIKVEDQFPDTEDGEDIWIFYERDGNPVVEIGYVCGDNLIKGQSERYPYPTHWQPYFKPEPPQEYLYT